MQDSKPVEKRKGYFKKGDPFILFTGIGMVMTIAMVIFVIAVILIKGFAFFWPRDLVQTTLKNGKSYLGEF